MVLFSTNELSTSNPNSRFSYKITFTSLSIHLGKKQDVIIPIVKTINHNIDNPPFSILYLPLKSLIAANPKAYPSSSNKNINIIINTNNNKIYTNRSMLTQCIVKYN